MKKKKINQKQNMKTKKEWGIKAPFLWVIWSEASIKYKRFRLCWLYKKVDETMYKLNGDCKNCDNVNVNASRLAHTSGNYSNGANAGTFYLNVNNSTSNTNANIGSHLTFLKNSLFISNPIMCLV